MPIVTEGQTQERKRRLWPLWLGLGLVAILLVAAVAVPAMRPVWLSLGGYHYTISAGYISDAVPLPRRLRALPQGYRHEKITGEDGEWSLRLGPCYYWVVYYR